MRVFVGAVGGVTGNVGRAPQNGSVTIDGVAQPEADARGRGGAGGRGPGVQ